MQAFLFFGVTKAVQGRLINVKDVELFRNELVNEFYRLKATSSSKHLAMA